MSGDRGEFLDRKAHVQCRLSARECGADVNSKETGLPMSTADDRAPHLGAMVRAVWQRMRDEAYASVGRAGFTDLQPAHLQVFRIPSPEGARPSELAARMQISKQSVNDLLGHLEQGGYLRREQDPADGRGRVVRLTARGRAVEAAVEAVAQEIEVKIASMLGAQRFAELRSTLAALSTDPW